jgi:hypothetical protein
VRDFLNEVERLEALGIRLFEVAVSDTASERRANARE